MPGMPKEVYSVESVRNIDRAAIEGEGIAGYTLMTRAGEAAVRAARQRFPGARRWLVVCGPGNNGGDGYVVARLAALDGMSVSVVAMTDPALLGGDAATAYGDFVANGGVAGNWAGSLDSDADLVVDAMLGSGLERELRGEFANAARAMNAHRATVVALDIPSGIHGDSGEILGEAVIADLTVTFVGLKAGLFDGKGPQHSGIVEFAGLDIPAHCRDGQQPVMLRIDDGCIRALLPKRARAAHKGDYGHVLVVGGGKGMPGAVLLCGAAVLRSGAGRVSLATHPSHAACIAPARPELMTHGIDTAADLEPLLAKADVVAFGPGLGISAWAEALYDVVASAGKPSVWDADALNLLARDKTPDDARVITPHPGEAGRLLGITAAEVQADRRAAHAALQRMYGGTVVLKGAGTLVSSSLSAPLLCTAGNPGMAAPGMGDVLTGIVASLRAQGLSADDAAAAGVQIHARAGDIAAIDGERGMTASDLLAELRHVANPVS